jgi:hypothetical protein
MIKKEIFLSLSVEDFKKYFKSKQERTVSSPTGHHMGHYKVALERLRRNNSTLPDLIITIA